MQKTLVVTLIGAPWLICFGLLAQPAPVFRAGAEYVPVDVIVTDANNVPISDLKVDEFEIYESGRRQSITDFRFVSIPVAARDLTISQPAPAGKDVVTNARVSPDSRLFVLLVDDVHMVESDVTTVKKIMSDFVRAVTADDEVAVMFAGRPDLNLNFTSDPGRMLKTIERTREALGVGTDASGRLGNDGRGSDERARADGGKAVAFAFRAAVQALAGSAHQRRAIVYVSAESPIAQKDAVEDARIANVPIYSVDPDLPHVNAGSHDDAAIGRRRDAFHAKSGGRGRSAIA